MFRVSASVPVAPGSRWNVRVAPRRGVRAARGGLYTSPVTAERGRSGAIMAGTCVRDRLAAAWAPAGTRGRAGTQAPGVLDSALPGVFPEPVHGPLGGVEDRYVPVIRAQP